jgi:hypothetical protein
MVRLAIPSAKGGLGRARGSGGQLRPRRPNTGHLGATGRPNVASEVARGKSWDLAFDFLPRVGLLPARA